MNIYDESNHDEGNAEYLARLGALSEERMPSREMKQRTLEAARAGGYVRSRPRATVTRSIALLAAAALIFIAGTFLGYALANRSSPPANTARASNHEAVAFAQGFTINSEPGRHVVWY